MAGDRLTDVRRAGARRQPQAPIEREEFEDIAVAARRRARPSPALAAEVVPALAEARPCPRRPPRARPARGKVEGNPVDKAAGVRIVDDERERGRPVGAPDQVNGGDRSGPSQVWRAGIAPPSTNAVLDSASWFMVVASVVGVAPAAQPATSDATRIRPRSPSVPGPIVLPSATRRVFRQGSPGQRRRTGEMAAIGPTATSWSGRSCRPPRTCRR